MRSMEVYRNIWLGNTGTKAVRDAFAAGFNSGQEHERRACAAIARDQEVRLALEEQEQPVEDREDRDAIAGAQLVACLIADRILARDAPTPPAATAPEPVNNEVPF